LKKFIYLFIVFFVSLPIFTNSSPLIGDLTKDELFLKDNNFYKNYLSTEPYEFNEIIDLDGISVKVLFGTWCHDSQREIPKLLRMLEDINLKPEKISLIGLDYDKKEPLNRGEMLGVKRTPTIIFYKDEIEIGRIEETPKIMFEGIGLVSVSLKKNLLFILNK
jgi:thiol-disulfide isomerase/thioredoxin